MLYPGSPLSIPLLACVARDFGFESVGLSETTDLRPWNMSDGVHPSAGA